MSKLKPLISLLSTKIKDSVMMMSTLADTSTHTQVTTLKM